MSIPSGDRVLIATTVAATPPGRAGVLFVHGLGSSRSTNVGRADAVCRASGATCLAVDLGGHGDSGGRLTQMTPRQNMADVVAAFDALAASPGVDPTRIGVCAASYGAYLSILLSAVRPVNRMLLRAPALYADDCFDLGLSQRRPGDTGSASTVLAHLAVFPGRVRIVESEHDEVIAREVIAAYLAARPGAEHVVLANARHALTDPAWRADFEQMVVSEFRSL